MRNLPIPLRATTAPHARAVVREQVDGEGVVPERDVRRGAGRGDDRPHDLEAGRVAEGVNDAAVAVPAFAGESELPVLLVELRAPGDEFLDLVRRFADDQFDHLAVAQPVARDERVLDVVLEAVFRRQHARECRPGRRNCCSR